MKLYALRKIMQTEIQNSEATDIDKLINSDPRYRTIRLLSELRTLKNQLNAQHVEKCKSGLPKCIDPDHLSNRINAKLTDITAKMLNIGGTSLSVDKELISAVEKLIEANNRKSFRMSKSPRKSQHISEKELNTYFDSLTELIKSLWNLYQISSKEEFLKKSTQLVEALYVLKGYKRTGNGLNKSECKFSELDKVLNYFK